MSNLSSITTHVLDTSLGRPANGVPVTLEVLKGDSFVVLGKGVTNADGRIVELLKQPLSEGIFRLTFQTSTYFLSKSLKSFYPSVQIQFEVQDAKQHYHVPLLVSPYGYSTYRGS